MTKRFTFDSEVGFIDNQKCGGDVVSNLEIIDLLNSLSKENEQLKQTMKEVVELLSDEVDLFSDKAIEHDINAYMELKELDNKDAFYMAKATKTAIKMLKGDVE